MPGFSSKVVARPAPLGAAALPKRLEKVAYTHFATEPVWAQNPDSQPNKSYPSHN